MPNLMKASVKKPYPSQLISLDSYAKGLFFEEFVVQLFNNDNFTLTKWRKSERLEDIMRLQDCVNPDLELVFCRHKQYRFAVECKWRAKFNKDKINWACKTQISTYQNFEYQSRIPVFVVIGIGGEPSRPESLFVTPLCNIASSSEVSEADLIPYKRKPTNKFFYDTKQLKLF